MGSTVFRLPSGIIKPSGYCPQVLDMSSGILNPIDALGINVSAICSTLFLVWPLGSRPMADFSALMSSDNPLN